MYLIQLIQYRKKIKIWNWTKTNSPKKIVKHIIFRRFKFKKKISNKWQFFGISCCDNHIYFALCIYKTFPKFTTFWLYFLLSPFSLNSFFLLLYMKPDTISIIISSITQTFHNIDPFTLKKFLFYNVTGIRRLFLHVNFCLFCKNLNGNTLKLLEAFHVKYL